MRLKNEETNRHRRVGLVERIMIARKELLQCDKIPQRFPHLLPIARHHIVVHPVAHSGLPFGRNALCNLALMMWEEQIHPSSMNIELLAQVLHPHSRALQMPPREAFTPWRRPTHNMLRTSFFPQREVQRISFTLLPV